VLYIGVGQFAPAAMSLEGTAWQAWSPEAVQAARNSGKPVFIDFTAAWCVTCQVNKKAVIDTEDVESAARSLGYARFLADWTNKDPAISAELARYRHNGVPLYIVISKSGAVKVLPELLTKDTLLSALKEGAN
jgi:thiol:disulfide interchange protein